MIVESVNLINVRSELASVAAAVAELHRILSGDTTGKERVYSLSAAKAKEGDNDQPEV